MSDEKPFAEVVGGMAFPHMERPVRSFVVRAECGDLCQYPIFQCDPEREKRIEDLAREQATTKAASLNSAVAARERKAAAQALRDLASDVRAAVGLTLIGKPSDPFWREHFAGLAEMRAAALEGGAT